MDRDLRRYFDEQLEIVLPKLPQLVQEALNKIPMLVDDFPPRKLLQEFQLDHREELQGLYTGRLRSKASTDDVPDLPEAIYLFREGIMALAADENGEVGEEALQKQIRVTIMHEVGHYYGLDEDDLQERGYG